MKFGKDNYKRTITLYDPEFISGFLIKSFEATYICIPQGELAQLARVLAWHARSHRFESGILHKKSHRLMGFFYLAKFFIFYLAMLKYEASSSILIFHHHSIMNTIRTLIFYFSQKILRKVIPL